MSNLNRGIPEKDYHFVPHHGAERYEAFITEGSRVEDVRFLEHYYEALSEYIHLQRCEKFKGLATTEKKRIINEYLQGTHFEDCPRPEMP